MIKTLLAVVAPSGPFKPKQNPKSYFIYFLFYKIVDVLELFFPFAYLLIAQLLSSSVSLPPVEFVLKKAFIQSDSVPVSLCKRPPGRLCTLKYTGTILFVIVFNQLDL